MEDAKYMQRNVWELLLERAKQSRSEQLFKWALHTAIAGHGENSLAAATVELDLSDYYQDRGDTHSSEHHADRALTAFRRFLYENPSLVERRCGCAILAKSATKAPNN